MRHHVEPDGRLHRQSSTSRRSSRTCRRIEVNQRFPLFFPELRPFFLEGAEIFEFPSPVQLVHTRTLVDPNLGAKLTGKVGRTTLGMMLTDDEAPGNGTTRTTRVGENARVLVGRARYDLYSEEPLGQEAPFK